VVCLDAAVGAPHAAPDPRDLAPDLAVNQQRLHCAADGEEPHGHVRGDER
jgi:hypothetical protein